MIDQARASQLAKEAFSSWESGRLEEAELLYRQALELADPFHWNLSAYHGEFACVLAGQGKNQEAEAELERALAVEINHHSDEASPAVLVARYFLADHLVRNGNPEKALGVIAPSLEAAPNNWYTRLAEAQAHHLSGDATMAKVAAESALASAPSEEKRVELRLLLQNVLGAADG